MQTWGLIGIALALYGVFRLVFGPLPQDPSYPILADARRCGPIPRAVPRSSLTRRALARRPLPR